MARKAGSADLPLHGGHVPKWLADRITRLGAGISEAIIHHYGRDELLRRLAHPFWFQSFGAVMGMDCHSSGIAGAYYPPDAPEYDICAPHQSLTGLRRVERVPFDTPRIDARLHLIYTNIIYRFMACSY